MKIKNLLVLGSAALAIGLSQLAIADVSVSKGVSLEQAQEVTVASQKINIEHIAPKTNINYIVIQDHLMKNAQVGASATVDILAQTCKIEMPVDTKFSSTHLGSNAYKEFLKDVVTPQNISEEQLRTEFAVIHEASHCNLYNIENPFIADDVQVQNNLNQFFKLSSFSEKDGNRFDGLYHTLQENYADTLATMELIRTYGDKPEIISIIQKISIERTGIAIDYSRQGFDSHSTSFSINEVLKPETISKILLASTNQDLQTMALEIANKGTFKMINTYSNVEDVTNQDSLNFGVASMVTKLLYSKVSTSTEKSNINLHLEKNKLYLTAQNTVNELEHTFQKDFTNFKTEKDVSNWIESHWDDILNESYNATNQTLGEQYDINNPIVESIVKYIKDSPKEIKQNIKQAKADGIKALASINKTNTIQSMLAIREEAKSQNQILLSTPKPN